MAVSKLKMAAKRISPEILNRMRTGTRDQRLFIGVKEPIYFAIYYFPEFFSYRLAPFHYDFAEDFVKLTNHQLDEAAWIAFRESAKTTFAKIFIIWCICFQKKRFINVDSHDSANSEGILFDVITWLQTNQRLIEDFGYLYRNPIRRKKEAFEADKDMKRTSVFITNHRKNKIMVRAYSTQQPTRGRSFGSGKRIVRPDLYIFDDVENFKTIRSRVTMDGIIEHIKEAFGGLSPDASVLFLGNYLTEEGVVQWAMNHAEANPKGIVRNIPVQKSDGEIVWYDKYVETDLEAAELNSKITRAEFRKVSLETKRRQLGDRAFQTDMMNDPAKAGDYYFDRNKVDDAIKDAKAPIKTSGSLKVWEGFNPRHRYGMGADTAEGIGADSNTLAVTDFSMTPKKIVATGKDNQISPDSHAYELKRVGEMYGECFIVPELNNTGYATVAALVSPNECAYYNVYKRIQKNKVTKKVTKEFGWKTTKSTKSDAFSKFRSAFEDGELEIPDKELLLEMRSFRNQDMRVIEKTDDGYEITKHFDLLMAAVLSWEASEHATITAVDKKAMYKAPKRDPYVV